MTTRLVTSCGDCPFNADSVSCMAVEYPQQNTLVGSILRKRNRDGSRFDEITERPDWCPLNAGPVTVDLDRRNSVSPLLTFRGQPVRREDLADRDVNPANGAPLVFVARCGSYEDQPVTTIITEAGACGEACGTSNCELPRGHEPCAHSIEVVDAPEHGGLCVLTGQHAPHRTASGFEWYGRKESSDE